MKRTPMYEQHVAAGGRMVDFGGWDLPVQYESSGIKRLQCAQNGLFDVSHGDHVGGRSEQ